MNDDDKKGFGTTLKSAFKAYGSLLTGDFKGFKEHAQDYAASNEATKNEWLDTVHQRKQDRQEFKQEMRDHLFKGDLAGVVSTYRDRLNQAVSNLRGQGAEPMQDSCNQSLPAPCVEAPAAQKSQGASGPGGL